MTITRTVTACQSCALLQRNNDGEPICMAFPEGIPADIFTHGFDHRIASYPGDNGILHQLDPDKADLVLEYQDQLDEGFLKPPSPRVVEELQKAKKAETVDRRDHAECHLRSSKAEWRDGNSNLVAVSDPGAAREPRTTPPVGGGSTVIGKRRAPGA